MKPAALLTAFLSLALLSPAWGRSLPELEKELMSNNLQLQALKASERAQQSLATAARGSFFPSISLNGGYGDENTFTDVHQGYLGSISGTWNLYKGGRDWALQKAASSQAEWAALEREQKARVLQRELREIYYTLLAHKKQLLLLEEKERLLKQQRQMAQKKINAGLTSAVDGLEIDLEENNILSETETLRTDIQRLQADLTRLINSTVDEKTISAQENFDTRTADINIEKGLQKNPAVLKQKLQEEISLQRLEQNRSAFLPQVNVEASYGRLTPQYGSPWDGNESKLFVVLSWNLFSGASDYYSTKAAFQDAEAQGLLKKNALREVQTEAENLLSSRTNILRRKEFLQQRLRFASSYYDMTLAEYKRGIKNSADLNVATSSLYESKRKVIELDRDLSIINAKINELIQE